MMIRTYELNEFLTSELVIFLFSPDCITSHHFDYYLDNKTPEKNAKIDISNAKIFTFEFKLFGMLMQTAER